MVNLVRLFIKTHLLALLQDNCLDMVGSLCFFAEVVSMREESNSILSTTTVADKIGRFGRYRYIGKTQISARYIGLSLTIIGIFIVQNFGICLHSYTFFSKV